MKRGRPKKNTAFRQSLERDFRAEKKRLASERRQLQERLNATRAEETKVRVVLKALDGSR